MRFEFIRRESLPMLAWCAHLRRGREVVEVWHGSCVETAADWFVEGAWAGPFGGGGVVEAAHLVGTAGRAEPGQVLCCSPTNLCDRIQSIRVDDDLYVSNSMSFLLQVTGDEPDPRYRRYQIDRIHQQQAGLRLVEKRLPTARGRHLLLHDYCTIAIRPDLSIRRLEKPATPVPVDYADYVGQLEQTIAAVQANAADLSRRQRRYRPVATVSRGYDANALAVLMRRHGAREAIAFTHVTEDDGTALAERLGYEVTVYERFAFRSLAGAPEAEFHATPWGGDVVMAVCEPQLAGALLVTGRRGDRLLGTRAPAAGALYYPRPGSLGGAMMSEFRLRVGFLHLVPFHVAALHPEAIHRISVAAEMRPWSVGGDYDRPIPRRILEEAGIPRDWFGGHKRATAQFRTKGLADMSAEGAASFSAFLRTMPRIPMGRRLARRCIGLLPKAAMPARRVSVEMDFAFHWAHARIRARYELGSRHDSEES